MEQKFCQSCGMPLTHSEEFGTEWDGGKSEDYCKYCYADGRFIAECSMEEMIESCIPFMIQANPQMSEASAREGMKKWFPTLKRWKQ